jgi:hypothetical protein
MKRVASRLALLCAGIGATACHEPFSNEDILFLKSLPRDVQFDVPDEGERTGSRLTPQQAMPSQAARFYRDMVRTSTETNRGIFDVLKYIETITSSAAIVRDEGRRAWGPIRPEPNEKFELLLVVDRISTATVVAYTSLSEPLETDVFYRYAFSGRQNVTAGWVQFLYGESVVFAANEEEATGYFCIDLAAIASLGGEKGAGSYCASYDFRGEQQTVELAVRIAGDIYVNPDAAFSLHREDDGSGRFFFSVRQNVFGSERPEISSYNVRWDETLAARADASVCGGDATYELWATECWDEQFFRTFLLSNIPNPDFASFGMLEGCPPEFRETDALAQPCRED